LAQFRGKTALLIFFNPGCGFCAQMLPDLAALPADGTGGRPVPLVVTVGNAEDNRRVFEEAGVRAPVLLDAQNQIASAYRANGTPTGYLIDAQGRIASELAVGAAALLALAVAPGTAASNGHRPHAGNRPLEESKINRSGLATGTPAPDFRLPRLGGGEISLAELRGRRVLLVFSDVNCGPCDQLAPRLEALARETPSVQVVIVSRGDEEANRVKAAQHGLTFPVALQKQWEVSKLYAMFATPIAYLIDEKGSIAADVAVGVEPILSLLAGGAPAATRQAQRAGK